MKRMTSRIALSAAALLLGVAATERLTAQQPPAVKRSVLLKQDMTIPGHEAVMASVELPPGSAEGKHSHPAEVYAFVLEGTPTMDVEGQPSKSLKAGDIFYIAPGKVHEGRNTGSTTAKLAVVFVAEKGKPLSTPAP